MPAAPAPRSVEWNFDDTVGVSKSPFSRQTQTFDWGASGLRGSVAMPVMDRTTGPAWVAFLANARKSKIFLFGDPLNRGPQNAGATGGAVSGSGQTGYTLNTSSSGLLPGDWIQLGERLYQVTDVAGGVLGIWPQIRESPAGGTTVVIANTQGFFRMTSKSVHMDERKIYTVTFEVEEAI